MKKHLFYLSKKTICLIAVMATLSVWSDDQKHYDYETLKNVFMLEFDLPFLNFMPEKPSDQILLKGTCIRDKLFSNFPVMKRISNYEIMITNISSETDPKRFQFERTLISQLHSNWTIFDFHIDDSINFIKKGKKTSCYILLQVDSRQ